MDIIRAGNFKMRAAKSFLKATAFGCLTVVKNSIDTGWKTSWRTRRLVSII